MKGFKVRACIRDPSNQEKIEHLQLLDGAGENLTLYKGDLLESGSYDEAFNGADGVLHCAAVVDIDSTGDEAIRKVVEPSVKESQTTDPIPRTPNTNPRLLLLTQCVSVPFSGH